MNKITRQDTVLEIPDLLEGWRCAEMIEEARSSLSEAQTLGENNGQRTAQGTWITTDNSRVFQERVAQLTGLPIENQEAVHVVRYTKGGEYKPHHDAFELTSEDWEKEGAARGGNRVFSVLVYLNQDFIGGETDFPTWKLTAEPEVGKAIAWRNIKECSSVDHASLHAGLPIIDGEKWIAIVWVREQAFDKPINTVDHNDTTPTAIDPPIKQTIINSPADAVKLGKRKHPTGFEIRQIPDTLMEFCNIWLNRQVFDEGLEDVGMSGTGMHFLPDNAREYIHLELHSELEKWIGEEIEKTYVYGIREYRKGNFLEMHTDRFETHHVSAILVLDTDKPWHLNIKTHLGETHAIDIKPGQMCFYESAVCEHGRPTPYEGDYYRNLFVHYQYKNGLYCNCDK